MAPHAFNVARYNGNTRVSVLADGHSALLAVSTLGLDVNVYLNHEDLQELSEAIFRALLKVSAEKEAA